MTPCRRCCRPAGAPGVELPCAATGQPVSVQVGPTGKFEGAEPAGAVAVIEDTESGWHPSDWTRSDCATGLFFASAQAASGWLVEHPGYAVVGMEFFVRAEASLYTRALAHAARPTTLSNLGSAQT